MFNNERCMKLDMIVCRVELGSFGLSGWNSLTYTNLSYGQVGLAFFLQFSNWVGFWVQIDPHSTNHMIERVCQVGRAMMEFAWIIVFFVTTVSFASQKLTTYLFIYFNIITIYFRCCSNIRIIGCSGASNAFYFGIISYHRHSPFHPRAYP
jgi:hypothetical protein